MLCRITDDPSYDYSDYCEGKGYYTPYEDAMLPMRMTLELNQRS